MKIEVTSFMDAYTVFKNDQWQLHLKLPFSKKKSKLEQYEILCFLCLNEHNRLNSDYYMIALFERFKLIQSSLECSKKRF